MEQVHSAEKENLVDAIDKNVIIGLQPTQLLEKLVEKMVSPKALTILVAVSIVTILLSLNLTIFVIAFYIVIYFTAKQTLERRRFLQKYASTRNLEYAETLKKEDLTGRLFRTINTHYDSAFIFGEYHSFPVKMMYYSYSIQRGRQRIVYDFTVTEVTMGQNVFPYILLQKNIMKKHQDSDILGDDKDVQVSLAAFDGIYSLYTTSKYEIEALQICTPEFVELFHKSPLQLSVEFGGNHVYIYTQSRLSTEKDLDELYSTTKTVIEKFGNFLLRMENDYRALHEVYKKDTNTL